MKITLSEGEQKLAMHVAEARYNANRAKGVVDRKVGRQDNWQTDLEGIAAEIAFCKHQNIYPDLEIGSYGIADCVSVKHGQVDVKSTKYKRGRLLAIRKKMELPMLPDTYVLMIGEFPTYEFAGYIPSSDLLQEHNLIDLGYGLTYGVEQPKLIKDENHGREATEPSENN